jgi:hypothetical protein
MFAKQMLFYLKVHELFAQAGLKLQSSYLSLPIARITTWTTSSWLFLSSSFF